ncbi:hypothetical protein WKW80_09700 [Variovorax humicola]|uniref:Phage baseplate protein n=1 Tax=Variovorax humicola TaxID=1769758 RepID=A0ABU8VWY1_9BURK
MTHLADADLLAVWERMRRAPLPRRVAALLAATTPQGVAADVGRLSLGESNRRLLALRNGMFGARLSCVANCAHCGERIEFDLDADELAHSLRAPEDAASLRVEQDGFAIDLTLPTVDDCIAAAASGDADEGYRLLMERCVRGVGPDGLEVVADALPDDLKNVVEDRLGSADPAAEMVLSFDCPACGHASRAPLDLAAFCWAEIESRAPRLLEEVHILASRYGWSEASILALSRVRRQHYMELARS